MVCACSVYGCKSRGAKGGPSFFSFPSDPIILKQWLTAIRRYDFKPSMYSRICSNHFKDSDISRTFGRIFLNKEAVPTIFKENERKKIRKNNTTSTTEKSTATGTTLVNSRITTKSCSSTTEKSINRITAKRNIGGITKNINTKVSTKKNTRSSRENTTRVSRGINTRASTESNTIITEKSNKVTEDIHTSNEQTLDDENLLTAELCEVTNMITESEPLEKSSPHLYSIWDLDHISTTQNNESETEDFDETEGFSTSAKKIILNQQNTIKYLNSENQKLSEQVKALRLLLEADSSVIDKNTKRLLSKASCGIVEVVHHAN